MNKKEILNAFKKYDLDKNRFIILSGASMVLQGIKQNTCDIDLCVDKNYYDFLSKKYDCEVEKIIDGEEILFIDNTINFATRYSDVRWEIVEGYKVQTAKSIKILKQNLNREKDKKDIELIDKFLIKNNIEK